MRIVILVVSDEWPLLASSRRTRARVLPLVALWGARGAGYGDFVPRPQRPGPWGLSSAPAVHQRAAGMTFIARIRASSTWQLAADCTAPHRLSASMPIRPHHLTWAHRGCSTAGRRSAVNCSPGVLRLLARPPRRAPRGISPIWPAYISGEPAGLWAPNTARRTRGSGTLGRPGMLTSPGAGDLRSASHHQGEALGLRARMCAPSLLFDDIRDAQGPP